MARKGTKGKAVAEPQPQPAPPLRPGKPSSLLDTRVVYCGDNLEQLKKLPDRCVDLIYPSAEAQPQRTISRQALRRVAAISSAFNRAPNCEVFWGETKEKRSFEDRHASTQAYIDYMRPRCVELARMTTSAGVC